MNLKPLILLVALIAGTAQAENLPDPTRPPIGIEGESHAAVAAPSGLQSIIHRPAGRSAAVINGQYVEMGGRVGDATLARIGEDFVELRSATGRETLYLTPGIGKKRAKP
jgi:MSHA biogenesis protein MshK